MKGISETLFGPKVELSRAMFVTISWRLESSPILETNNSLDIDANAYYKNAVAWAFENGIVFVWMRTIMHNVL